MTVDCFRYQPVGVESTRRSWITDRAYLPWLRLQYAKPDSHSDRNRWRPPLGHRDPNVPVRRGAALIRHPSRCPAIARRSRGARAANHVGGSDGADVRRVDDRTRPRLAAVARDIRLGTTARQRLPQCGCDVAAWQPADRPLHQRADRRHVVAFDRTRVDGLEHDCRVPRYRGRAWRCGSARTTHRLSGLRTFHGSTNPTASPITSRISYARTDRIHLVSSWLASLLAGAHAPIDRGDGSGMNLMELATGQWSRAAIDATAPQLEASCPRPSRHRLSSARFRRSGRAASTCLLRASSRGRGTTCAASSERD